MNIAARLAAVHAGLAISIALAGFAAFAITGCDDGREPIFDATLTARGDAQRQEIEAEIAELANFRKPLNDAEATKRYHDAKDKLIARGAAIENQLIEALLGNRDWAVRLGVVDVLKATGTRVSIEPLISTLVDPEPLVALNAEHLLQGLTAHREIPEHGKPAGANGLPPVPLRDPKELALDADEKLWAAWHRENGGKLKQAWAAWWAANKDKVKVE
jgi:hypothetical protein